MADNLTTMGNSSPAPKPRVAVVALAGGLLVLSLVFAAEIGLRIYQRVEFGVPLTAWIPSVPSNPFPLDPFLVFGPRVNWEVPGRGGGPHTRFNNQGFRTPEPVGPKQPGELRVITIGGSTTEDLWNDAGIHWPLVMECRLRQAGRTDVRVLNAGMSAYSSAHALVQLEFDILAHQPDLITVLHNINDLTVSYGAAVSRQPVDPSYRVRFAQKEFTGVRGEEDVVVSRLWRALVGRIRPEPVPAELEGPVDHGPALAIFERNLTSIVAVARAHGVDVVFLTMAEADSDSLYAYTRGGFRTGQATVGPLPADRTSFSRDFASYNTAIESAAARTGTSMIPMHALMDRSASNFADAVHFTTEGTLAFGTTMAEAMLPLLPAAHGPLAPHSPSDPSCDWNGRR